MPLQSGFRPSSRATSVLLRRWGRRWQGRESQPQAAYPRSWVSGLRPRLPAGRKFHSPRSSRAGRGRRGLRL